MAISLQRRNWIEQWLMELVKWSQKKVLAGILVKWSRENSCQTEELINKKTEQIEELQGGGG
jgi:hypothetical protein